MLLSFRNRLTVVLCPTQIAVSVTGRGWRPKTSNPSTLSFDSAADVAVWRTPLTVLDDWLSQRKQAGADIELIVSDAFARYVLVPWSDDVQKPAEIAALARIHFETQFGAAAADWEIRVDRSGYGRPAICCALDKSFLAELDTLLKAHKLRLTSLQPYFMRACNRWRNRFGGNVLFAVSGMGQCVLSSMRNGAWHSIRTVRLGENDRVNTAISIEREILLQGLDAQSTILLHALEPVSASLFKPDLKVTMLETSALSAAQPPALAMLMQGAA